MAKRAEHKSYKVEVQKGPISMHEQYSEQLRREPEHTIRDMEHLRMRQDKMTLTLHTPKQ
jgi:hypothetical protein